MLHAGAQPIDYSNLCSLVTPEGTATHSPLAHFRIVDMLRHSLGFYGHEISKEDFGISPDGARFFGLLALKSPYGDYTDTVGLRNSHDKTFPIGVAFGSEVFVCDNLAFSAETVIKRKHTPNAWRDLHGLVGGIVEGLMVARDRQAKQIENYKTVELTDAATDHAVLEMYRQGVVTITRVPELLKEYAKPRHAEWGERKAWTLFNATTQILEGRVAEDPSITTRLHKIIDGVCDKIAA
jgi:hypothetical protein